VAEVSLETGQPVKVILLPGKARHPDGCPERGCPAALLEGNLAAFLL